eukprot:CAMPEP_0202347974 /NCGR_PEP_ID=MMETSP1126-20121109/6106_1 /ASSEMBLY_ACC=CAM_ASM_000457 /TAXON_ID=3047 /ORGANISM="Dunaliella tertiolecta, Strain CCMP1320" /LENGTH=78 /DNA_ID=CAMNT_0048939601 /DNA_START=91 /DNA_END=327 /DNA_ORIENTATION=+
MKHVAALLLAQLGGNANPGEADVKAILSSVGVEANAGELSKLMAAAPAAGGGGAAPAAKKEEKKEESEEEDMGFSLFD